MRNFRCVIGVLLLSLLPSSLTVAETLSLPSDPRAWIGSDPVSVEAMRGKSIVLYFFEEDCPRCREKWPAILAAAEQFQSQPVMLIGVNSGSQPNEVARYVQQLQITIPVIIDLDRSLETAAGVGEISLENIIQGLTIDPRGEIQRVFPTDMVQTLQEAAEGASWNIDPSGMPAKVIPIWREIEFGSFAPSAKLLNRLGNDRDANVKAAAERLMTYVEAQLSEAVGNADASSESNEKWQAYQQYLSVSKEFAGYDVPEKVTEKIEQLRDDDQIKREIDAAKQYEIVDRSMRSGRAKPKRIEAMLQKIIEKHPNTSAAELAQQQMSQLPQ